MTEQDVPSSAPAGWRKGAVALHLTRRLSHYRIDASHNLKVFGGKYE
ncbi:MAG: hypothetical protein M0T74_09675 [Desulfitobacterium hafniense]|nr:hypothetical protein [Desulfitobacterium hafniense]